MTKRFFIELSYDGSDYHGWQVQPASKTIQETLNNALSQILRQEIYAVGCGRTDTGVHAKQYFAHFDTIPINDTDDLTYRLNCVLPFSIAIQRIFEVPQEAHARFSAVSRSYEYLIVQRKQPFAVNRMWELHDPLDLEKMNEASAILTEYEDFTSFSKSNTQTETNLCTVSSAVWRREDHVVIFEISANRFLRNMVRAIVGTIIDVGKGNLDMASFRSIIESKNRSKAGSSVPAHGLYLKEIVYPEGIIP